MTPRLMSLSRKAKWRLPELSEIRKESLIFSFLFLEVCVGGLLSGRPCAEAHQCGSFSRDDIMRRTVDAAL